MTDKAKINKVRAKALGNETAYPNSVDNDGFTKREAIWKGALEALLGNPAMMDRALTFQDLVYQEYVIDAGTFTDALLEAMAESL